MSKKLSVFLMALFVVVGIIGFFLIIPEPVSLVKEEKSVICNDGICEVSVMRLYSDGSGAGTQSTVPETLLHDTKSETTCSNGYLITKTTEYQEGYPVAVASSINSDNKCSK